MKRKNTLRMGAVIIAAPLPAQGKPHLTYDWYRSRSSARARSRRS
jgi:hypothetical protein